MISVLFSANNHKNNRAQQRVCIGGNKVYNLLDHIFFSIGNIYIYTSAGIQQSAGTAKDHRNECIFRIQFGMRLEHSTN